MQWNSHLYDHGQGFVTEYGKDLLHFIPTQGELSILDLGCGTGDLSAEIAKLHPQIQGIDASKEMIDAAKQKYPQLQFSVMDACELPFTNTFDLIFSNAVLHWIKAQDRLHQKIFAALKEGGLLICEFGAIGNIQSIFTCYNQCIQKYGATFPSPFYFPTAQQHALMLEQQGFTIEKIYEFDRPTILPNGEQGLRQWVLQFFSADIQQYSQSQQEDILTCMENTLRPTAFNGESYSADYRRLRVIAHKKKACASDL